MSPNDSQYLHELGHYKSLCEDLLTELKCALDLLQEIEEKYSIISKKTGELHTTCEALIHEEVRSVTIKHESC